MTVALTCHQPYYFHIIFIEIFSIFIENFHIIFLHVLQLVLCRSPVTDDILSSLCKHWPLLLKKVWFRKKKL